MWLILIGALATIAAFSLLLQDAWASSGGPLRRAIAAAAAFFAIAGIWQHVAFLRLERRLAALRSAAL